ncbi:phosphotransferase enzyme family protein [Bacillus sp. 1P06AnD]|uniref:phosphotransferase enzyme family protein n=1 Tax=Bacillus sp. 1P06AnD TaxID=3132208 RepID=UPI0039A0BCF2
METEVEVLFTQQIIEYGADLFGMNSQSLKKLGEYESYIFEGERQMRQVILRFTHSSHRTLDQLEAECDFVQYLKENGIHVYKQFKSRNYKFAEGLETKNGSQFYVTCYEKLSGRRAETADMENHRFLEQWGNTIGKMHSLAIGYEPVASIPKRKSWREEELLNLQSNGDKIPIHILEYADSVVSELDAFPVTKNNYGLIHSDLHTGNFLIENNHLNVFDFDDCTYHWFASDIAIPLYYSLVRANLSSKEATRRFTEFFLTHFLEGYRKAKDLEQTEIEAIPLFLRLRDITLLSFMYKKFDFDQLSINEKSLFDQVFERVNTQSTITPLDFLGWK